MRTNVPIIIPTPKKIIDAGTIIEKLFVFNRPQQQLFIGYNKFSYLYFNWTPIRSAAIMNMNTCSFMLLEQRIGAKWFHKSVHGAGVELVTA